MGNFDIHYEIEARWSKGYPDSNERKSIIVPFFNVYSKEEVREVMTNFLGQIGMDNSNVEYLRDSDFEYSFNINDYELMGDIKITPYLVKDNVACFELKQIPFRDLGLEGK